MDPSNLQMMTFRIRLVDVSDQYGDIEFQLPHGLQVGLSLYI